MEELRKELLQHQAHVVDLAKWKMILIGAVAATGLGWSSSIAPSEESGVLLLYCGGFLAAYADVLIYGRLLAIAVLGRFMRQHPVDNPNHQVLQDWEHFGNKVREVGARGISERWAHFASSIVVAVGLPLLARDRYPTEWDTRLVIPALGVVAVVGVFLRFSNARAKLVSNRPLQSSRTEVGAEQTIQSA